MVVETQLGKSTLENGVRTSAELQLHCNVQGKVALAFAKQLGGGSTARGPAGDHALHRGRSHTTSTPGQ
jgi:hypothetical protein